MHGLVDAARIVAPAAEAERDDGISVLIPILEEIAGWDGARIRALFTAHGLVVQDWDKSRTDSLTIRDIAAAPHAAA